jgi:hypothetical protein
MLALLADDRPPFLLGVDLCLEMFPSGLNLFTPRFGLLTTLPPVVAVDLQILQAAFEQLGLIFRLLAFHLPPIAALLEKRHQLSHGTSEFHFRHFAIPFRSLVVPSPANQNGTNGT